MEGLRVPTVMSIKIIRSILLQLYMVIIMTIRVIQYDITVYYIIQIKMGVLKSGLIWVLSHNTSNEYVWIEISNIRAL